MENGFSIIVPVYQAEKYLSECIESILRQTYRKFELLLIEDGSKDRSGEICDAFALQDERIHVIHQKNQGVSAARNVGMESASMDYIVFVDADDYIADNFLALVNQKLQNQEDICMLCNHIKVYQDDGEVRTNHMLPEELQGKQDKRSLVNILCTCYFPYATWEIVWKRGLTGEFDKNCLIEDTKFNAEYILHANKFTFLCEALYYYRIGENNIVTKWHKERKKEFHIAQIMYQGVFYEQLLLTGFAETNYLQEKINAQFYNIVYFSKGMSRADKRQLWKTICEYESMFLASNSWGRKSIFWIFKTFGYENCVDIIRLISSLRLKFKSLFLI